MRTLHNGRNPFRRAGALFCVFALIAALSPAVHALGADPARISAATQTAQQAPACTSIGDFYWEIGDATGTLASGQIGSTYSANKSINIASASKWVFGAYVLQKLGGKGGLGEEQVAKLQMRSGHTAFNPFMCGFSRTVGGCFSAGSNSKVKPFDIGRFSYGGGHSQKLAVDMGLGNMSSDQLTAEVMRYIGNDGLHYAHPQLAGGLEGPPSAYAAFLRKVVAGQLVMKQYLGYKPVCTLPGFCISASYSPAKEAWHYSLNHWIEDDPRTGDGAFSSPGAFGFYPWISADKATYGVLAREKLGATAYIDSAMCGRLIRRAWFSKQPVLR
ncbi:MAG: hypothetical protein P4L83_03355 [Nevskia sp.]|nr:hypothetical protein [Nevskia sp.]